MARFLVVGAGRVGRGLVADLLQNDHEVTCIDSDEKSIKALKELDVPEVGPVGISSANIEHMVSWGAWPDRIKAQDCIISAVPYENNLALLSRAIECGAHFIDLGGNNDVVEEQFKLSKAAAEEGICAVPDCGVAPGLVSLLATHLIIQTPLTKRKDMKVRMMVGGLPLRRTNPLQYETVFSVHGLLNEYLEPAVIIEKGKMITVPSLYGKRPVRGFGPAFDPMEAFYTSGGISTMAKTWEGKVGSMSYRTIRYEGHMRQMDLLLDLFVRGKSPESRARFEEMLAEAIPETGEDVILLRVEADDMRVQIIDYPRDGLSAMSRMTAFPASIMAQMLVGGVAKPGVWPQEDLFKDHTGAIIGALKKRNVEITTQGIDL